MDFFPDHVAGGVVEHLAHLGAGGCIAGGGLEAAGAVVGVALGHPVGRGHRVEQARGGVGVLRGLDAAVAEAAHRPHPTTGIVVVLHRLAVHAHDPTRLAAAVVLGVDSKL